LFNGGTHVHVMKLPHLANVTIRPKERK